ncbi:efflux RND transporter periplasmic adaptor subunit [Qingshengfaniella alkalisoli]|uniref:Efflux RND transporter periplasmic adaptor subunit n=1 Tax=Qingshengfaniella alkalisoli TaxID=2599296 RepID=A0A5B8IW31_9RHOB|nr:efflux RND transporter periplasmic adaptor subunit [Qingshengfaniella alkalisoli]QDY69703.1 efflux RND transporter periplasmic adaptor subunit [Qingshengfaniella alkalisoli]
MTRNLWAGSVLLICAATAVPAQPVDPAHRGIVRAVQRAEIGNDLGFVLSRLPFREGDRFKKGDVLAAFDCRDLEAELRAAEALMQQEELTRANNARLAELNATGTFEVRLSEAKVAQSTAQVEAIHSRLDRCEIEAPFDGTVAAVYANAFELANPSEPFIEIVDTNDLEIDLLVPSDWLRWLSPGAEFDIAIDETGQELAARIIRIVPQVDAVSQTVKVIGQFSGPAENVLPGMSGPVRFEQPGGNDG